MAKDPSETWRAIAFTAAAAAVAAVAIAAPMFLAGSTSPARAADNRAESVKWFAKMETVMTHPRCANCHDGDDFPRQADDNHKHVNDVVRSALDRGAGGTGPGAGANAAPCFVCHMDTNTADGRMPGAPNWRLAPESMGWGFQHGAELCKHLKDQDRNNGRDPAALLEHMKTDPVVLWAFDPGTRTKPPLTKEQFIDAVSNWVTTGAYCPDT